MATPSVPLDSCCQTVNTLQTFIGEFSEVLAWQRVGRYNRPFPDARNAHSGDLPGRFPAHVCAERVDLARPFSLRT